MQRRKTALFLFSNGEEIIPLANNLVGHDWDILASVENIEFLENGGINKKNLHPLSWGNQDSLISPKSNTLLGIITKEEDRAILDKHGIPEIDLICVDFHEKKEKNIEMLESEYVKVFLTAAAISGNKIIICSIDDRKNVATWINKEMPNKINFLLRLKSTASLIISQLFLNLGLDYDHLRK